MVNYYLSSCIELSQSFWHYALEMIDGTLLINFCIYNELFQIWIVKNFLKLKLIRNLYIEVVSKIK